MHSRMALVSELTSTFEKANGRSIDRVLVLGDGDGRLLGQLRSILPEADFVALDSSKQMLHLQMKSFQRAEVLGTQGLGTQGSGTLTTIHADAREHSLERASFDLVVVAFFLDCFSRSDLLEHLPRWLGTLQRGGLVYYVDFNEPKQGWRRIFARGMLWILHAAFRMLTDFTNHRLVDVDAMIRDGEWYSTQERLLHADRIVARIYAHKSNIHWDSNNVRRYGE